MRLVCLFALTSFSLLLSSCGGGGGTNPPPVVQQSVGGIWRGQFTTTAGTSVTGLALVTEEGKFFSEAKNLGNDCADVGMGTLSVSGDAVTGSEEIGIVNFATANAINTSCQFPDGSSWGSGTISGSVAQRSTLTLTGKGTTANGTALPSNTVTLTYDSLYSESSSLGKLAGNWTGPTGLVMNINPNGAVFAQDPTSGCIVNGHLSMINAKYNAYSASATYSNCTGNASALNGLTATGLASLDDGVNPNVLYLGYSLTLATGEVLIVVADATRPPVVAPSDLQYPAPPVFMLATSITPLVPTVTGTVTGYAVSPSLPAGLTLNAVTGVISGKPTAPVAQTTYTVTASNAGGSTQTTLSISVSGTPEVAYTSPSYAYTRGVTAQTVTPTTGGGAVVTWSISPGLPAGLTLNATSGSISGTPTASASAATFVVTAVNSYGQATATLSIAVAPAALLDLGHANSLKFIQFDPSHVLSEDEVGHWVLWNYATSAEIVSGSAPCIDIYACSTGYLPVALAGPTVVVGTGTGLEARSAASGAVLAEIPTGVNLSDMPTQIPWWALATDGSYVCAGNTTGLTCWTPTGVKLFAEAGSYANARAFATPTALFVALGAKGQNVIETVASSNWASSVGPTFTGSFYSWFIDGSRFFTSIASSNTLWVYSNNSLQQDTRSLPSLENLTGQGTWFWTNQPEQPTRPLRIYAVGNSSLPTATYNLDIDSSVVPSGTTIGVLEYGTGLVNVIDLSGATPVETPYNVPVGYLYAYGSVSGSEWMAGNSLGVLLDGSGLPGAVRYFGYGAVSSIAGSSARATLATASGGILSFNAATNALEQTINFSSSETALSSDGTVLAAEATANYAQYETDRTINIYAMPTATLINSFPFTFGLYPFPTDMTLSASGTTLGEVLYASSLPSFSRQSIAITGGAPTWSDTSHITQTEPVHLSPDGTLVAVSSGSPDSNSGGAITTNIYQNGTIVTSLSGWAVGWLDNSRLLVNNYSTNQPVYLGANIYGPTGTQLASPPIPELRSIQLVTSDLVYAPSINQILSLTTGAPTWVSGDATVGLGAVAGSEVVFLSGNLVLAQPY